MFWGDSYLQINSSGRNTQDGMLEVATNDAQSLLARGDNAALWDIPADFIVKP